MPPPPLPRSIDRRRSRWRRLAGRFQNALLGWEVMRAGRRTGSLALGRVAVGCLLLGAMWALYSASFSGEATYTGNATEIGKRLNNFAQWFAVTFFAVQSIAVLLLTPIFVAGAIFEERETRSGEVLLTTELTRREIYVGKLGARMIQVLLIVLAGMPIVFLTQLWGGVSLSAIAVNYAAACFTVVGAGTVTAAIAARSETLNSAILRSYAALIVVDVLLLPASPFFVIFMSMAHWGAGLTVGLLIYFPSQMGIIALAYSSGQRWLRLAMLRQRRSLPLSGGPPPLPDDPVRATRALTDDDDPLLWKERRTHRLITIRQGLKRALAVPEPTKINDDLRQLGLLAWALTSRHLPAYWLRVACLLLGMLLWLGMVAGLINANWSLRYLGGLLLMWVLTVVGLAASSGISRERQKHTLVDLLMLPGERRHLLRVKAIAALWRAQWPIVLAFTVIVACALAGGCSLLALPMLLVSFACLVTFALGMGSYISTRCANQVNANSTWIGAMFGALVATFLLAEANVQLELEPGQPPLLDYPAWSRVVNPLLSWGRLCVVARGDAWYAVTVGREPLAITTADLVPALVCPALFAVIGLVFWRLAVTRFDHDGRQ